LSLNYDVVVIGAGYIGCAVAYYLTSAGLRTALLDRGGVAAGASRANYGNVQVQDSELRYSLPLTVTGFARCEQLEEELGQPVGYRRLGGLLVIETETQWQTVEARLPALHAAGIQAEMVPARHLLEVEPLINTDILLGGCYHQTEAQVYPFALLWAYLQRAGERGLALYLNTELLELDLQGGRVRGLRTTAGDMQASVVVLCTGAWTRELGRQLGRSWEISHVHGQALVTEAGPQQLNCHISSAAFFEDIHDGTQDGGAVLAVAQSMHGHFLLGEAGFITTDTGSMVTPEGPTAVAAVVQRYFPWMRNLRILRGWAAPVAFTGDNLPFLGPVSGIEGLILATAFKSTVIVTPLVGETVAELITTGQTTLDLTPFSPDRTISHGL
jgi:glycine/D-amino acid oxidase-like deaminating enzyme